MLDTDGVNAYAAPGGFVHITRGLLGLMKNEAELAGVLGHEITHITVKHTIRAIQKSKGISIGADVGGGGGGLQTGSSRRWRATAFNKIFDGEFSRDDEDESDKVGAQLANKVGYAPSGMAEVLKKIAGAERRPAGPQRLVRVAPGHQGPHREDREADQAEKLTATAIGGGALRPVHHVRSQADHRDRDGRRRSGRSRRRRQEEGATRQGRTRRSEEDEAKKGGRSALGSITGSKQSQSSQQASSAGARGGVPDRDAKGGPEQERARREDHRRRTRGLQEGDRRPETGSRTSTDI